MGYIANIDNQIKAGKISHKEGSELKTHYYSLNNRDREVLDRKFPGSYSSASSTNKYKPKNIPDNESKELYTSCDNGKFGFNSQGLFFENDDTIEDLFLNTIKQ